MRARVRSVGGPGLKRIQYPLSESKFQMSIWRREADSGKLALVVIVCASSVRVAADVRAPAFRQSCNLDAHIG